MTLPLSASAQTVLERRILGDDESPEELWQRVANHVASGEGTQVSALGEAISDRSTIRDDFHTTLASRRFLPNSPTLVNAGKTLGQLAACFVLPIEDSIYGIFTTLRSAALIHQSGGGTGFSFSGLRPRGARVSSTGNPASGPVSFMRVFDAATSSIKQGGIRRGANMGVLRVDHPDIREFIDSKRDGSLPNFNMSVALTDDYMKALEDDRPFQLTWGGKVWSTIKPHALWEALVESAWATGDPGIIFIDHINRHNPTPWLGRIEAPNPCGEAHLLPNQTCTLGSINLALMVKDDGPDWGMIQDTVGIAIRFLDDVVTVNQYPLDVIERGTGLTRKVGLGVMGWADMLSQLSIPYDSERALILADSLMGYINGVARSASHNLAVLKGPYPASRNGDGSLPLRNATRTVIAPTGTISLVGDCSSGIEPHFSIVRYHNIMDTRVTVVNPYYRPGVDPAFWKTAHEIHWRDHVKMQAAFQQHVDDGISKTINMPTDATEADVSAAYLLAWELGCKGVTVFRDGCKGEQVIEGGEICTECCVPMRKEGSCWFCDCGISYCS